MTVAKKALPQVDGDFYYIGTILSGDGQDLLGRVRAFIETEVAPIIYWRREEFPYQIVPGLAALGIAGTPYRGYGCPGKTTLKSIHSSWAE